VQLSLVSPNAVMRQIIRSNFSSLFPSKI